MGDSPDADGFVATFERITDNIQRVVQGKPTQVELATTCLLAGGHLLIEDLPGVGKTLLARCLAASLQVPMKRIQFTPDLLPSDITGTDVYLPGTGEREFRPGPVFANVVLADEINRATPRAQSALLEAMEERRVTVGGVTRSLPDVFLVVATQNPVDMDGTYPLPEAQLDRFLMRIRMGYPDFEAEKRVLAAKVDDRVTGFSVSVGAAAGVAAHPGHGVASNGAAGDLAVGAGDRTAGSARAQTPGPASSYGPAASAGESSLPVDPVVDRTEVLRMVQLARQTRVADPVYSYILQITRMTRLLVIGPAEERARPSRTGARRPRAEQDPPDAPPPGLAETLTLGASPRASVGLLRAAQVRARRAGRDHVRPDDVKQLAVPVLAHRLSLSPAALLGGRGADDVVRGVLTSVEVPR